jgi:hypothetical protein
MGQRPFLFACTTALTFVLGSACAPATPQQDAGPDANDRLVILTPRNAASFSAADDVDANTEGLQIQVQVAVDGALGKNVTPTLTTSLSDTAL